MPYTNSIASETKLHHRFGSVGIIQLSPGGRRSGRRPWSFNPFITRIPLMVRRAGSFSNTYPDPVRVPEVLENPLGVSDFRVKYLIKRVGSPTQCFTGRPSGLFQSAFPFSS